MGDTWTQSQASVRIKFVTMLFQLKSSEQLVYFSAKWFRPPHKDQSRINDMLLWQDVLALIEIAYFIYGIGSLI